jgi:hypothetical protein
MVDCSGHGCFWDRVSVQRDDVRFPSFSSFGHDETEAVQSEGDRER